MQYPEKWLQGASLGTRISSELRLQIIRGSIPAGHILSENQIASDFGTSRSPVREALKVLSNEGLLRLERMGAVVLGLTAEDIEELYDVRFLLESFALQRISADFDQGQAETFFHIIDNMELAAKHSDYIEFSYYDLLFHETIIRKANHTRILHLWNHIKQIILALLLVATEKRFSKDKETVRSLLENHKSTVRAMLSKEVSNIDQVIQEHNLETRITVTNAYFSNRMGE